MMPAQLSCCAKCLELVAKLREDFGAIDLWCKSGDMQCRLTPTGDNGGEGLHPRGPLDFMRSAR